MKYLGDFSFNTFFIRKQGYFSQGFTLPELLVALAVVTILITLSGPSLKSLIANQQVAATAQELYKSLLLARSEAVKRQQSVSLCSSTDGAACDEANSGWHHGWLVFTDRDADGILDSEDALIRVSAKRSSLQMSIIWNRGFFLTFNSRGQTVTAGTFEICDDQEVRAIILSMTGRARIESREVCG